MKKPLTPAAFPLSESQELEARCSAQRVKQAAKMKQNRTLASVGCTVLLTLGAITAWSARTTNRAPAAQQATLPTKHLCYGADVAPKWGSLDIQDQVVRGLNEQECKEWRAKQIKENKTQGIWAERVDPPAHATSVCWDPCPSWVFKHLYD